MATSRKRYYVRPDGMHEAIRKINGKRVAFRGKSDREVEQKMRDYKEVAAKGRKLKDIAAEWERLREKDCTEKTMVAYSKDARKLVAEFGELPASEITTQMLQKYIFELSLTHKKTSCQQERTVIKMIFNHAVIAGDIPTSPAIVLTIPHNAAPMKSHPVLTEEQERAVITWESRRNANCVSLWYFLLFTGLRRGEALALSYGDIDRENSVIHITKKVSFLNPQLPKIENFLKSKNGKRDVPLFQPLAEKLPQNRIGLIFPGKDGGLMKAGEFRSNWIDFCREIGFVEQHKNSDGSTKEIFSLTPHSFRHSFATICYEAGIDARQAAKILGDTPQITDAVYTHLRQKKEEISWEKMDRFVSQKEAATV